MQPLETGYDVAVHRSAVTPFERLLVTRKHWLLLGCVGFALVGVAAGVELAFSVQRVHPGVRVNGVDIGGLSETEAAARLDAAFAERASVPITVTAAGGLAWTLDPAALGMNLDTARLARRAIGVGWEGSPARCLADRLTAWTAGVDLDIPPSFDPTRLDAALEPIATALAVPPTSAKASLRDLQTWTTPSASGGCLDREALTAQLSNLLVGERRPIEAASMIDLPAVSDQQAWAAAEKASRMFQGPIDARWRGRTLRFDRKEVATWITFAQETTGYTAAFDRRSVKEGLMEAVGREIKPLAIEPRLKIVDGAVTILPGRVGMGIDMDHVMRQLDAIAADEKKPRVIELTTALAFPDATVESLQAMNIKDRLSRFRTSYASVADRVNNIHLLAGTLDGKLVAPGAVFSFNEAVGRRTAAKGYREAPTIVKGKLVPTLGGGICQVGTTFFNAIFESGLAVVERSNHSLYLSSYPMGRDATVSWGGPDIRFQNDTAHWVLIHTSVTPNSITVELWGTDVGRQVTTTTGPWYGVRDFKTIETPDPTLPEGTRVVDEKGQIGRSCKVTRTVTQDGVVIRDEVFVSNYVPKKTEARIGTNKELAGAVEASAAAHAAPAAP